MSDAPFMLGISGCRGIVGETMTLQVAAQLAACWGARLAACHEAPLVCIGRDSRPSGAELSAAAAAGLVGTGCRVVDLGIIATPTAGVAIGALQAAGGVLITASHNPAQWNGLKLLDHRGTAPDATLAGSIIDDYNAGGPDGIDATARVEIDADSRANDTHLAKLFGRLDPRRIMEAAPKVLLDSVRGAGGPAGAALLQRLGCDLVHLEAAPDGCFPRMPEPTAANLADLGPQVVQAGAMVGFVQDPDADRLAMLDAQGRYIGEEYTLALAAWAVLRDRPGEPAVANLSTSRLIDDVASRFGSTVHRAAVGEANVAACMRDVNAAIGGEGNGGVILPEVTFVRDSLSAMMLVLDLAVAEGATIAELVEALPRRAMHKEARPLASRDALAPALGRLQAAFAADQVNTTDGVRVDLEEGWAHVRPSNTEPIVRIITEAQDEDAAAALAGQVASAAGLN